MARCHITLMLFTTFAVLLPSDKTFFVAMARSTDNAHKACIASSKKSFFCRTPIFVTKIGGEFLNATDFTGKTCYIWCTPFAYDLFLRRTRQVDFLATKDFRTSFATFIFD